MTGSKRLAHYLLPPVLFDVTRPMRQGRAVRRYLRDRTYHYGYTLHRQRVFQHAIADQALLDGFRAQAPLPAKYGRDVDERCIEFPWALAHFGSDPELVLDAGSTLNHEYIVKWPGLAKKTLYTLTLAPESDCYWWRGISYLYADLRSIPLRDGLFDTIVCMSVLEHIGMDNTAYVDDDAYRESKPDDFLLVIRELRRVLKPGGRLLLSVPFGRYERHDWFQQFDRDLLSQAIDAFGVASSVREEFFRNSPEGWSRATDAECEDASYGAGVRGAGSVACLLLRA